MNALFSLQPPFALPKVMLLPLREQPAYRVTQNTASCNLVELLAAVIGGAQQIEIAEALLIRFTDLRALSRAHVAEIASIKGIGQPTAVRIKAALALGGRLMIPDDDQPYIHSPVDAAALVQYEMGMLEQEYLRIILLDTRNRLMRIVEVYHGSLNSAMIRMAEVFKPAIQCQAASIIMVHNHPSGDASPSTDDVVVTRSAFQAGKLLDINLLDHLIIGSAGKWVSLKNRGLGFT